MPRAKKPDQDGKEVKKRSRNGCWPCKSRKVKCGEEKPTCINCQRQGETCDYSIRLNWEGRSKKKDDGKFGQSVMSMTQSIDFINPSPPATIPVQPSTSMNGQFQIQGQPPSAVGPSQAQLPESMLPSISNFDGGIPVPVSQYELGHQQQGMSTLNWNEKPGEASVISQPAMPPMRYPLPPQQYPSPGEMGFGTPGILPANVNPVPNSIQMPPPMPTSNLTSFPESVRSPYNGAKRMRLSPRTDSFGKSNHTVHRTGSYGSIDQDEQPRVQFHIPVYLPHYLQNPLTPATSSTSLVSQDNGDRRISVSSLLSEDPDPDDRRPSYTSDPSRYAEPPPSRRGSLHQKMMSYAETETYGHDRGNRDLDIPRNDDTTAISGVTPSEHSEYESWLGQADVGVPEFGFGYSRETVFAKGGYYASPVPVKIPRKLDPLPAALTENPMNLLYFHHFLNHTARILVPHDCPENPFKTILPQMAVDDPNLLNLLLTYSACHRARLLNHPEPKNRIAEWVRDVFPSLRHCLENAASTEISNETLATAIMLASLEIISPSSFGVSVPWQSHLNIARSIILSRGGPHSISRKDPVMYFLTRWLAYLDVLGSLCGRRNETPLFAGNYWSSSHDDTSTKELSLEDDDGEDEDDYTIDCLLGFTTRCVTILAQVALLAGQCENGRLDPHTGQINGAWRPSEDIVRQALRLQRDLEKARNHKAIKCAHDSPKLHKVHPVSHSISCEPGFGYAAMNSNEAEEAQAINLAFHWAGLLHLLRRVHNLPRHDMQVQNAVHEIVRVLSKVREGGSAAGCLLFPIFIAGVEAEDPIDRASISARIRGIEGLGMCQVSRARKIMDQVWKTGENWESLTAGDFFG